MKSEKIRLPARLKPGDTIGVVAPAGPFDREILSRGTRVFEDMGFVVFIPAGLFEADGYLVVRKACSASVDFEDRDRFRNIFDTLARHRIGHSMSDLVVCAYQG